MGTQPKCVQTPIITSHSGLFTRSASDCGSRRVSTLWGVVSELLDYSSKKGGILDTLSVLDFIFRPVSDEDWLASPFDEHVLSFRDRRQVEFDLGLG